MGCCAPRARGFQDRSSSARATASRMDGQENKHSTQVQTTTDSEGGAQRGLDGAQGRTPARMHDRVRTEGRGCGCKHSTEPAIYNFTLDQLTRETIKGRQFRESCRNRKRFLSAIAQQNQRHPDKTSYKLIIQPLRVPIRITSEPAVKSSSKRVSAAKSTQNRRRKNAAAAPLAPLVFRRDGSSD